MIEFFQKLFVSDFMPHGHCYFWSPTIVWLQVISNSLIATAYYSIPLTLLYFVRQRKDLVFPWMFLLFGTFIVLCGTTHILQIWTLWHGTYRMEGMVNLLTGIVSVTTAVLLVPLVPKALALPSPSQLEQRNRELNEHIVERKRAEQALQLAHDEMEGRVLQRTAELRVLNDRLQEEIQERIRSQEAQQRLEKQVQHSQRLESLGVLAGGIAHDFNNLLVAILGNTELALMDLPQYSPVKQRLEDVRATAVRAADLTSQMLAYSGKGRFAVQPVAINELIREMSNLLTISISKNAVLRFNFSENLPRIVADPGQMRQVVMNLITNASEAIGDKSGIISISTGLLHADEQYLAHTYLNDNLQAGYYVSLEVADTGCGMAPSVQEKIFDPFFTTKFTGRGLGLAAILGIVRGHGGAIRVYSEEGKGTAFKILLPAGAETVVHPTNSDNESVRNWKGSGTVLVIDDEEAVRNVARMMLERAGFTVLTAVDGRAGLEIFQQRAEGIAVVLLDLTMPHMSGEEAFRVLKRIRSDVPVILTSGYSEQDTAAQFAGKGIAGFVQKPFRFEKLLEQFHAVLQNRTPSA
jgi:signal transduction histidine kinase/ActR/RegA family two-component response regulator